MSLDSSGSDESEEEDESLDIDELNEALLAHVAFDPEYEKRQQHDFCDTLRLVGDPGTDEEAGGGENDNADTLLDHLVVLEKDVTAAQLSALWEQQQLGDDIDNSTTTKAPVHAARTADSIRFCVEALWDVRLTKYERDHLRCEPELFREARRRLLDAPLGKTGDASPGTDPDIERALPTPDDYRLAEELAAAAERPRQAGPPAPMALTADEKKKKVFTVAMRGTTLLVTIENYVHVTYFVNALTGDLCKFSLRDLATRLLDFYVEYSCKKFAKVNLRLHDGLSFLLYTSSVLVETGSDNQLLSRRLLQYVVALLRERCGYPHINIRRRKCQNIVATGKLSYRVCMLVLKHRFQAAREKEGFSGLVIKHRDLVKFWQARDQGDDGYECVQTRHYVDDECDDDVINLINSVNDRKQMVHVQQQQQVGGGAAKETGGGRTIINEYGEEEDEEKAFQRISKLTDEYDQGVGNGNGSGCDATLLNGTCIVFPEGQVIWTGCKTDRELVSGMPLLKRLTYLCSELNPENRRMEASLAAQRKAVRSNITPNNNTNNDFIV